MSNRLHGRIAVFFSGLIIIGTSTLVSSYLAEGTAGANTELGSGNTGLNTGWVEEPFFSQPGNEDPVWSWALYGGAVTWEAWSITGGGGDYDLLTQDFWDGYLGSEAGSGDPSNHDDAYIYVSGLGAVHYDGQTNISTALGDGTCPYSETDPPYDPCNESEKNTNGHGFKDPIVSGYILYQSNYGYPPVYANGAQTLPVLSGYRS